MGRIKLFSDFVALYIDGFKNMTWGKPLWIIIIIKLFIMFVILRVFFFPNFLNTKYDTDTQKSDFVCSELTKKTTPLINKTNESD